MQNKPVLTPVWFLAAIVLVAGTYSLVLLNSPLGQRHLQGTRVILSFFLWPAIMVIEIIVYWFIRNRIRSRRLMWAHLLLGLCAFIVLPGLFMASVALMSVYSPGNFAENIRMVSRLEQILFWACVAAGSIIFIVLLIQAFSKTPGPLPETTSSGIFDE
jgi:hypothetical protein